MDSDLILLTQDGFLIKAGFLFVGAILAGVGISAVKGVHILSWDFWENPLYGVIWTYLIVMALVLTYPNSEFTEDVIMAMWAIGVFGFPYILEKIIGKFQEDLKNG